MVNTVLPTSSFHLYYQSLLDTQRTHNFKKAIEACVAPGSIVLELSGGTGIFSWMAAQKAKKVYFVEPDGEKAEVAQGFLRNNLNGHRVTVVNENPSTYVPPEPVSVVLCELLNSAMLSSKQIQTIEAFKRNFVKRFGADIPMPRFIPEHTFLGLQLVDESYSFGGYHAPVVVYSEPTLPHPNTKELSDAVLYAQFEYGKPLPQVFATSQEVPVSMKGEVNAIRFITKNILAILVQSEETVDWHNYYLTVPLPKPIAVEAGDRVKVSFSYEVGSDPQNLSVTASKV